MAEKEGKYPHTQIEKKWQERWEKEKAFAAPSKPDKNKKLYVLDMFPYPSGSGLHVGHVEGYTATDIYSRYKRMRGFEVLHPMGWDAFGLPAENYAIKTGIPPAKTTADAIETFRRQIKELGLSYDWSREIGAHMPEYYRWTQWFFLFLYNNGLAYKKKALVNWDPVDQTVLANEQVLPDGTAERSGAKVEKKELEQWFFKITDFADALCDDLALVDWPESTKAAQRNWIGRSEGAELSFLLDFKKNPADNERRGPNGEKAQIKVFTTRPDTLFGATYMVLAPEHPWVTLAVDDSHDVLENKADVRAYVEAARGKSDMDRSAEGKEKTGIELKGVTAINPATKEQIPMYVADYVLGHYGTGAIMAVPAHDERDFEFAQKFGIAIKEVVIPRLPDPTNPHVPGKEIVFRRATINVVYDPKTDKYLTLRWKTQPWTTYVTGGVEEGEDLVASALREIAEETGYADVHFVRKLGGDAQAEFYAAHKGVNRVARNSMLLFELASDARGDIAPEEVAQHEVAWVPAAQLGATRFQHSEDLLIKERLKAPASVYTGPGVLVDSDLFSGMESEEAKKKITAAVGGHMRKTYRLRDWLISRQRYWGAPIPVVYDPEGKPHPIPEKHLPWLLPTDVEFKPTGTSPLGQSKELKERTEKIFGAGWRPEVDTMDTFVCSSWYYYRFADPHNEQAFASPEAIKAWLPVDLYVGGAEHTVLHLLYARFFTKALQKHGYVSFGEPFLTLRHQGTILAEDGTKMSKSKGNVINPDDVVERYGADTLRLYEMFMGPLEAMKPWSMQNIVGVRRFLERVWKLEPADAPIPAELETLLNQTIKKVGDDIENLKMNTAVSALMILLNELEKGCPKAAYGAFIALLAPLAPHIAHELSEQRGADLSAWPLFDQNKLASGSVSVAVQVGGRTRGTVELAAGATEEEALAAARENPAIAKWLLGDIVKVVYVQGKILSVVVK